MNCRFPYIPDFSEEVPILSDAEKKIVSGFDSNIAAIMQDKIFFIRDAARRKGIISANLKKLQSKSGKPFVRERKKGRWDYDDYARATVKERSSLPGFPPTVVEVAYLCRPMNSLFSPRGKKLHGCGWVKGIPTEKKYNDLGPLSGSAGIKYYCRICGELIGESIHTRSLH